MKFQELPASSYFTIIDPKKEMPVLIKDTKGEVRSMAFLPFLDIEIKPDTEVQPVYLKKSSSA